MKTMVNFNAHDWYWKASDGDVFSSRRLMSVPESDRDYRAWLAAGNIPTGWPRDADGDESDEALQDVLGAYGIVAFVHDRDAGSWRPSTSSDRLAPAIKAECAKRIFAVADSITQSNLTAAAAAGAFDEADLATYRAALGWVDAMRAKCREMIAGVDTAFTRDSKWPAVPAGVVDLANRF